MDMAIRRLGTPPRLSQRYLQRNTTTSTRRPRKRNRMHMGNLTHHNKHKKETKKYKQVIRKKKHNKTKTGQWHCELIFYNIFITPRCPLGGPGIFFLALCWCTGIPQVRDRKYFFYPSNRQTPDQGIRCIQGLDLRQIVKHKTYYKAHYVMQTLQGRVRNMQYLTNKPRHHPVIREPRFHPTLLLTPQKTLRSNSQPVGQAKKVRCVQTSNPWPPARIHCDFGGDRVLVFGIRFCCCVGQLFRCCSVGSWVII